MPCSRAIATTSSIGWRVPTSLLAHITETSATDAGSRSTRARSASGSTPAGLVDRQQLDLGALVLGEPVAAGRARRGARSRWRGSRRAARVRVAARPEEALDREVVGLGAAGGEHDLAGPGAERRGDRLAGLLDDPPGTAARRRAARTGCRRGRGGRSSPRPPPAASGWSPRGRGRPSRGESTAAAWRGPVAAAAQRLALLGSPA